MNDWSWNASPRRSLVLNSPLLAPELQEFKGMVTAVGWRNRLFHWGVELGFLRTTLAQGLSWIVYLCLETFFHCRLIYLRIRRTENGIRGILCSLPFAVSVILDLSYKRKPEAWLSHLTALSSLTTATSGIFRIKVCITGTNPVEHWDKTSCHLKLI